MKRIAFLTAILGMLFLIACQSVEEPVQEVNSTALGEVISPGVCKNINQKNLLATIANTQNPNGKATARSVLAHSKIGPFTSVFAVDNSSPITRRPAVFNWVVDAPIGTHKVVVTARFYCNSAGRVTSVRNVSVVKVKRSGDWVGLPARNTILTRDSKTVYVYTMPHPSSRSAPQLRLAFDRSTGRTTLPKDMAGIRAPLDLDNLRVDPSSDRRSKPFISSCPECKDEAERFSHHWNTWDNLLTRLEQAKSTFRHRKNVTNQRNAEMSAAYIGLGTACGWTIWSKKGIKTCITAASAAGVTTGNQTISFEAQRDAKETLVKRENEYDRYMASGAYKKALNAYYTCVGKYPVCKE